MRQRKNYRLLAMLLAGIIVPILTAFLLVWVGIASGCELAGEAAPRCVVAGVDLGWAIARLLDLTWQLPLQFFFPFFWILAVVGILVLIHQQLRGRLRLTLALLSIGYVPLTPSVLGTLFVIRLAALGNCTINESGTSICHVFGVNMGDQFSQAMVLPWLGVVVVPIVLVMVAGYLGVWMLVRLKTARK